MTKIEIDDIADAIAKLPAMFHGRKADPSCVYKTAVVETLSNQLAKHGAFEPTEFRRRCYS